MNNDAIFDKIEAWLSGELPEAAARAFEAEMAADAALATEVERHRRGREALDRLAEQALQEDMARWRTSMHDLPEPPAEDPPLKGNAKGGRWILAGLLLLLLASATYWLWPGANMTPVKTSTPDTTPVPTQSNTPVALQPDGEPANEVKVPQQTPDKGAAQRMALAETNLKDFRGAIQQQYGQTMGDDEEENPSFTAGVKAFKQNDLKAAKKDLLLVGKTDPAFPSAQEILAYIYSKEKNYQKAAACYESFARQSSDPVTDWRLIQFYLLDYSNHQADFTQKIAEIAAPGNHHRFQKAAEKLRKELAGEK